jgi:hypothetical protein
MMKMMKSGLLLTLVFALGGLCDARGEEVEHKGGGYHFTRQATYLYTDFLGGDNATTLGIETDAKFGLGSLHARHIMYLEVMDYPRPIPGKIGLVPSGDPEALDGATGIGDLLTGIWLSGAHHEGQKLELGYGMGLQLPTASDDSIGSSQWSAGPSIDIEYRSGAFFAGTIIMQLWSFAGDSDAKDVNMLIAKYFLMYDLNEDWKLISIPYGVTYYWNKSSGEALSLPIGGGVQRNFSIGKQEMSLHAQYFEYVERPSKGSEADLRFTLEFYF